MFLCFICLLSWSGLFELSLSSYPFFLIFLVFSFILFLRFSLSSPSASIFFLIIQSIFSNTYHFDAPSRFPSLFSCFFFVSLLLFSFFLFYFSISTPPFSSLHPYLHHTYPLTLYSLFPLTLSRFLFFIYFYFYSLHYFTNVLDGHVLDTLLGDVSDLMAAWYHFSGFIGCYMAYVIFIVTVWDWMVTYMTLFISLFMIEYMTSFMPLSGIASSQTGSNEKISLELQAG